MGGVAIARAIDQPHQPVAGQHQHHHVRQGHGGHGAGGVGQGAPQARNPVGGQLAGRAGLVEIVYCGGGGGQRLGEVAHGLEQRHRPRPGKRPQDQRRQMAIAVIGKVAGHRPADEMGQIAQERHEFRGALGFGQARRQQRAQQPGPGIGGDEGGRRHLEPVGQHGHGDAADIQRRIDGRRGHGGAETVQLDQPAAAEFIGEAGHHEQRRQHEGGDHPVGGREQRQGGGDQHQRQRRQRGGPQRQPPPRRRLGGQHAWLGGVDDEGHHHRRALDVDHEQKRQPREREDAEGVGVESARQQEQGQEIGARDHALFHQRQGAHPVAGDAEQHGGHSARALCRRRGWVHAYSPAVEKGAAPGAGANR